MKATGIVRRIDDLGRIVIPKEIRRTLRIHEGDPLELFITETPRGKRGVCFEPYAVQEDALGICNELMDVLSDSEWGRHLTTELGKVRTGIREELKRREEQNV